MTAPRTTAPRAPRTAGPARLATAAAVLATACWAAVALAGASAAVPGLGPGRLPVDLPVDLDLGASSATVTAVLAVAVLAGGCALLAGLVAVGRGWSPRPLLAVGAVTALLTVLLPPVGSADHLSYAAYGRIAALGADPYLVPPDAFAGGQDPVASAVRDPWRSTTSVYGPVAALLQALTSLLGGTSVRSTVWCWQLLMLLVLAASAVLLHRSLNGRARARAHVLWSANPLLLLVGLGGAHVDVLAGAAALAVLLLARRHPGWAGVALGVAAGTKLPYGAVGAGVLVATLLVRERGGLRRLLAGLAGALLVLLPAHAWAGPHAYDQTSRAARYVSLATVWRPLVEAGLPRGALPAGTAVLALVVLALWWHRWGRPGAAPGGAPGGDDAFRAVAAGTATLLALGYLLAAPYALPWYDALLWGPLACAAAVPAVERLLAVRAGLLALAYVPGLVDGMSPLVQDVTLGYRREVGPWLAWASLGGVLVLGAVSRRRHRAGESVAGAAGDALS